MMKRSVILLLPVLVVYSCSSIKKLETTAPFSLGETFAQEWTIEEEPQNSGYEVVIPILSLDNDKAILKNLYHKGKMMTLEIKLTEIGNVAIAEFGQDATKENVQGAVTPEMGDEPFPFTLTETQAVISYVNNEKVKYYKIDGIRRNLPVSFTTARAKKER